MIDHDREAVQDRLRNLGFQVEPIPEDNQNRLPDLIARSDGSSMYVEVKKRLVDNSLKAAMEAVLPGTTETIQTSADKQNSLSTDLKQASRQLQQVAGPNDFRLVWYRVDDNPFVPPFTDQLGSTLYGIRCVAVDEPKGRRLRACAYAGFADFYRFTEIDGVVLEIDSLISLFLNPFSCRRATFRTSRIARLLADALFDVDASEARGDLYAAAPDAPRHNDKELLQHLREKYPTHSIVEFVRVYAGTTITTIDGRSQGA